MKFYLIDEENGTVDELESERYINALNEALGLLRKSVINRTEYLHHRGINKQ
jgi:hypothetical protein